MTEWIVAEGSVTNYARSINWLYFLRSMAAWLGLCFPIGSDSLAVWKNFKAFAHTGLFNWRSCKLKAPVKFKECGRTKSEPAQYPVHMPWLILLGLLIIPGCGDSCQRKWTQPPLISKESTRRANIFRPLTEL